MFNRKDNEHTEDVPLAKEGFIEITPKRDFIISHNEDQIELKAGKKIEVPTKYVQNLKTEGVI